MSTLDNAQPPAENLESGLAFETLIAELSSRFIDLPPDEVDREIEDALRRVCEPLGLDLAALWQWSGPDPGVATPTHLYAREGLPPPGPMRLEQFPWHAEQMLAGRIVALSSWEALPAEAAVDRETGRLIGIKSNLAIPLSVMGEPPLGALGLYTLREKRDWPDALVKRLQRVAQIFASGLARKRHELALQQSGARLATGAELAGLAFYEVDYSEGITYADDRLRDLTGVPPDRVSAVQAIEFWIEHLHPDDRERMLDLRRQLHEGTLDQLSLEYRYLHPARGEIWIHHLFRVARRDAGGRALKTFGALRDITEAKRAEIALRDLSRRLIRAHEDERALLARELHDDVTQRLAVLAIEAGRAELAAPVGAQADAMRSIRAELVRLSEDIHSLAYQLHPSILEELGLAEALRAECERRQRQGQPRPVGGPRSGARPSRKDAALCLFRVAQEALNNVARHAAARAASVTLRQMDGGLLLAVRDDGVGFDPATSAEPAGASASRACANACSW